MSEEQVVSMVIGLTVVLGAAIVAILAQKSSSVSKLLLRLVTSFGWEGSRRIWWSGAMRGRWRSLEVELRHIGRQKGVPERLLITVKTSAPARVMVKRRTGGFLSKPLTLLGPPLVEPMNLASPERFWIRSDELAFAERLFSHSEVAPALETNLISAFDVVELRQRQLRVLRAVDDHAVKKHFNRPFLKFGRDLELIETIGSEEWRLAVVIVEALGLRGY